jgi:hypothetical protein
MLNLLGILFIIFGFVAPHFLGYLPPGSMVFFWIAFFLLLWPTNPLLKTLNWPRWARIGLVGNVVVTIFFLVLIYLKNYEFFFRFFYIPYPIATILHILFRDEIPLGVVGRTIITISVFFNLLIYIGVAIILGKLIVRKPQQNKLADSA